MEKKENSFYNKIRKLGQDLSERKTLAGQFMRELELSQYGFSFTSGSLQRVEAHEKELKIMQELEKRIKEQTQKVARLNRFSEHMHFLTDMEVVEIYQVIHNEEQELQMLIKKLEKLQNKNANNEGHALKIENEIKSL